MMFGRVSKLDSNSSTLSFDPSSNQAQLQAKLAALQDFIEGHMIEKASFKKHFMTYTVLAVPLK